MTSEIKTYIVRTHADKEFDGYYNHANVMDTKYENENILVLEVEVPEWYASAYERELDRDSAVISYREAA